MVGRLETVVLEARDPRALAEFYAAVLGLPITRMEDDWVAIGDGDTTRLSFQRAPGHQPPHFPDPAASMQFHLDIEVDDIEAAEARVLALGATRLPGGGTSFRVYADPAGHPFCLCHD